MSKSHLWTPHQVKRGVVDIPLGAFGLSFTAELAGELVRPIWGVAVHTMPLVTVAEYIELVDDTGRQVWKDKHGAISAAEPKALKELGLSPANWHHSLLDPSRSQRVNVGQHVRYRAGPDCGIGEIVNIYPDGHCDVVFSVGRVSWINLRRLVPVENDELQLMVLQERYEKSPTEENLSQIYELISANPTLSGRLSDSVKRLPKIFPYLSSEDQLGVVLYRLMALQERYEKSSTEENLSQIYELISANPTLSGRLSDSVKRFSKIFPYLSSEDQLGVVLHRFSIIAHQDVPHELIEAIFGILSSAPDLKSQVPQSLRRNSRIIGFFDPIEQARVAWSTTTTEIDQLWPDLSWRAKIFCIFRAAKESINLLAHAPKIRGESDPLVQAALNILWAKFNPERRERAFLKANDLIQDHVISQAWLSTDPIDLTPLLPPCRPGVVGHCEGRPWPTDEDKNQNRKQASRAFCPRLRGECELCDENSSGEKNARIYPNVAFDWSLWSLQELLAAAGVSPRVAGLRDSDEYVNKLAGWLNRLNDIRERMRCSVCNEIMLPNQEYAKQLAAYRATVFFCKFGAGHDRDVYLNHCWGCDAQIIDNRESAIKIEGYYICIRCASGPKTSNNYRQGDICPMCGQMLQEEDGFQRRFHCFKCSHEFFIPPSNKLTGSPDPNIRRKPLLELGHIRF